MNNNKSNLAHCTAPRFAECVALGQEYSTSGVIDVAEEVKRMPEDKRMELFERELINIASQLDRLTRLIKETRNDYVLRSELEGLESSSPAPEPEPQTVEGVPEGTTLSGQTRGTTYYLTVKNGIFMVGASQYKSLSAAAEGVSGVRRSGWTFWKLPDGRTVKDAFKG